VDVRDARERDEEPLPAQPSLHLPMPRILAEAAGLELDRLYLLVCASGKRSAAAADLLRSQGFRGCRSLHGGLKALKASA
jgi:rhodanese-related sulfurtransferase